MNIEQILDPLYCIKVKENTSIENDWLQDYRSICDNLCTVYNLLEDSFFDIVKDVEQGSLSLLNESETYERTIQAIEKYLQRVRDRITHLKTLQPPADIAQANTITTQINKNTENVHGFYNNVFSNSDLVNQLDGVGEKLSIRTKCNEYFFEIQSLHDLLNRMGKGLIKMRL
jgi:hypothetical protein